MPPRRLSVTVNGTRFHVLGVPRAPFRDLFHGFLRASWPVALASLAGGYVALNAVFALVYWLVGGLANSHGTLREAFYFSVQTMGTIGYGAMYPTTDAANLLVVAESIVGLVVTAVATGAVFSRIGRSTERVTFARACGISEHNGVPTVLVRVGYERITPLLDVTYRVTFGRTERTREGVLFYRTYPLALVRAEAGALRTAFTLLHVIDATSPLAGYDVARFKADEGELTVTVSGLDEVTLQPVHASHLYDDDHVLFGARPADILTPLPDGSMELDLTQFHAIVRTDDAA